MDRLLLAAASLIPSAPVMLVWIIGITIAGLRFRTHRRSSALLGVALVGLLLQRVCVAPLFAVLPMSLMDAGWSASNMSNLFVAINIVEGLAAALWYSLIIAAVVLGDARPTSDLGHP